MSEEYQKRETVISGNLFNATIEPNLAKVLTFLSVIAAIYIVCMCYQQTSNVVVHIWVVV